VVTAVLAKRELLDGGAMVVQPPNQQAEEIAYWQDTVRARDAHMEEARGRGLALVQPLLHRQR
jgi:hypothetical protein